MEKILIYILIFLELKPTVSLQLYKAKKPH